MPVYCRFPGIFVPNYPKFFCGTGCGNSIEHLLCHSLQRSYRYWAKEKSAVKQTSIFSMCFLLFLHSRQLNFLLQFHYAFPEGTVGIHQVFNCLAGMDYRGMIAAAKMFANRFQ